MFDLAFFESHWFPRKKRNLLKTVGGIKSRTAIIWGQKKKILIPWLVRGSKCAQDHGESRCSIIGAQKRCVWKRHKKKRFFRPKTAILGQKISQEYALWSAILFEYSMIVLLTQFFHLQKKNFKKKTFFRQKMTIFGYFWSKNLTRSCFMISNPF